MKIYSISTLSSIAILLTIIGCGGSEKSTVTVKGTVPGTLIEAFCEDGSYHSVNSTDNNTSKHPFLLTIPADTNCRIVMTTNENDPTNRVITPIGFVDANGTQDVTFSLQGDIDLGHIPLALRPNDITDGNGDHVSDTPYRIHLNQLRDHNRSSASLHVRHGRVMDSNNNGIVDAYEDLDGDGTIDAYEDDDHDGIPNMRDDDNHDGRPDYMEGRDHNGTRNNNRNNNRENNRENHGGKPQRW